MGSMYNSYAVKILLNVPDLEDLVSGCEKPTKYIVEIEIETIFALS